MSLRDQHEIDGEMNGKNLPLSRLVICKWIG